MEPPNERSLYSNCSNITMEDVHKLVLTRGITGIVCFFVCFVSLVLEVIHICLRKGSTVLQRFFIYVIVSNLLRASLLSVDIFTHDGSLKVDEKVCEAIGFFSQYFASFQLLTIIGMMSLLYHSLFKLNLKYKNLCSRLFKNLPYVEFFIMIILFLLPSLFAWVPFVIQGGLYGDAGPWCWLKAFADDSNCTVPSANFILESVLWNVPFGFVLLFCLTCVTFYLAFFIYIRFCRPVYRKKLTPILVEICIWFLFFALYSSLCIIEIASLMLTDKTATSYSWLVLYAVTLPIGEISLSLSSFAHFIHLCKSWKPLLKYHDDDVSKLLSNDRKMEPSCRISAKSYTSQQERPGFLSPSTAEPTSIHPEINQYGALES